MGHDLQEYQQRRGTRTSTTNPHFVVITRSQIYHDMFIPIHPLSSIDVNEGIRAFRREMKNAIDQLTGRRT